MSWSDRRRTLSFMWMLFLVVLALLLFPGLAGAQVTFSTSSYGTADYPWSIDAGSFDSDGDVDLVTANLGDNNASVLLNNGNGTFATKSDYGAGSGTRSVAVGDFDEGDYEDLAVANNSDNDISIILNDGDGTFGTKTDYSTTGSGPYPVVVEDFDKDGYLDLAIARVSGNRVEIMLGNGDGTFDSGIEYSVSATSYSLATGYFDSDSYPDLVVANAYGSYVYVLLNDGDGTFGSASSYAVDSSSYAVATGDFDEDGYDDIVAATDSTDVVSVLLNDGDGTFGTATDYGVGDSPQAVTVGDFNMDDHLDIAVANYGDGDVSILLGDGDGDFGTKTDYAVGSGPHGIVAGDFNGDNKTDLAAANSNDDTVSVLLNTTTINTAPTVDAGLDDVINYPSSATLDATVSDDGLPSTPGTYTVTWTKQSGPGTVTFGSSSSVDTTAAFSASGTYVLRLTADDGEATDYDDVTIEVNDAPSVNAGLDDVVNYPSSATLDATVSDDGLPSSPGTYTVTWTKQSGPGTVTFGSASSVDTTAAFSASGTYVLRLTADDGEATGYDEVTIEVNDAPSVNAGLDDVVNYPSSATLDATVSDDGLPSTPGTYTVLWTKQSGPGTVTFGSVSSVDTTAAFSVSGTYVLRLTADDSETTDYDEVTIEINAAPSVNAGLDDSVTYPSSATLDATVSDDSLPSSPGTVTTTWTKQSGPGTVTFDNASSVDTTAGFDASGTYVLRLTANDGSAEAFDEVEITVDDSSGSPSSVTFSVSSYGTADYPWAIDAGSFDSDGDVDLVTANLGDENASVLLNNGNGTFATKSDYGAGSGTRSVAVGDFDEGDYEDLAVANNSDNDISIILNDGDGTFGTKTDYSTTGSGPYSVAVEDFDKDGYLDLAFARTSGNRVEIMLGNGDGSFDSGVEYSVSATSYSLATGYFDSGSYPDVVVANAYGSYVYVLLNDGDGTFGSASSYAVDSSSYAVATGDFDEDGYDDIVAATNSTDVVSVLLNDGDGTFGTATDYGVGDDPQAVTVADFNWDGHLDIAVANYQDSDVSVLLGVGDGTFGTKTDYAVGSGPHGIVAGDFNGDNKTDLATANSNDDTVSVLLNTSTGSSNAAPTVDAGLDDIITYPSSATLDATVSDDGLPSTPGTYTVTWTKQSGPGTVTFGNASAVDTTAAFSASGTYVLRLTADDGDLDDYDDVTIEVNAAPNVNAGIDDSVTYPSSATLDATVSDDGLPSSPGSVTTTWSITSGPGTVTFGNSSAVDTTAAFSVAGTYVLRLTAGDGDTTAYDEVTITVNSSGGGNAAPEVNAGSDQGILVTGSATLDATVTDDDLPDPPATVTTTWTKQSGPGTVTFGNSSAVDTTAAFDTVGTYVLRLTASDSSLSDYDELTVTVLESGTFILPCKIEAEDYKEGGEGVAYHDTSAGNAGGLYRSDDVDIFSCPDTGGGYTLLYNVAQGEWTAYDIYVPEDTNYDITMRVSYEGVVDVSMQVLIDDENVATPTWSSTGGYNIYDDCIVQNVWLTAGTHVLKMYRDSGAWSAGFNYITFSEPVQEAPVVDVGPDQEITLPTATVTLDATVTDDGNPNPPSEVTVAWHVVSAPLGGYVEFADRYAVDTTATFAQTGLYVPGTYVLRLTARDSIAYGWDDITITVNDAASRVDLPGRLEAEDYSNQGEGVSYHDTTAGNAGSTYRSDDVDIESCGDTGGGYDVYTVAADEWLAFDVEVPVDTVCYDVTARVSSTTSSREMHVEVDGMDVTGPMTFDSTGGWADVTAEGVHLAAGKHKVKVVMDTGDFKINYVDFLAETYEEYIVEGGVANADIVISSSPERMVELAADELQEIIEDISGATLPIVTTPTAADVHIYVGRSSYTDALGVTPDGLEWEEFRIATGDDWMVLIGNDTNYVPIQPTKNDTAGLATWDAITGSSYLIPMEENIYAYSDEMDLWQCDGQGSLQAVYEFLRDLGCRWYFPGDAHEIVPSMSDIGLPAVNRTVKPDFDLRNLMMWHYFFLDCNDDTDILWQLRMGLNRGEKSKGWMQGGHGLHWVIAREEIKEAHPEYYALVNGVRDTVGYDGDGWPCLSSTGLFAENINFLECYFDHYDEPACSVSPTDGYQMCECELCEGLDTPERGVSGKLSDYTHAYANDVAEEIYLTYPSKNIVTHAYAFSFLPPLDIEEFSPNVVASFARFSSELEDEEYYPQYIEFIDSWLDLLSPKQILIADYFIDSTSWHYPGYPFYYTQVLKKEMRRYKGINMGLFVEVDRSYVSDPYDVNATTHLNCYVASRLLWDADLDLEALLDEYYDKFYGPAGDEMKAFVEYSEANCYEATMGDGNSSFLTQVRSLLDDAIDAADGQGVYETRVAMGDKYLQVSENEPPSVSAGDDDSVTLPATASLDGTVSDDGLPTTPGTVTTTWTKTSGPGTVTFGNSSAVDTTAAFSAAGTYVLRLTADDDYVEAYDEVTITVSE